jgi:26S proteasome regulatory complex component, contains PCI domain
VEAQKVALTKTPGLGSRIDIVLTLVRIGFFFGDHQLITTHLAKAETYVHRMPHFLITLFTYDPPLLPIPPTLRLIEAGGDWDRRNRLKVYSGLHLLSTRQFKRGGELFIDALSTFTASELLSYHDFVALTVIANTLSLKRVELKKKVGVAL